MILAMRARTARPAPPTAPGASPPSWRALMDEAERAEIDLAARCPTRPTPHYAAHWARTLEFLRIVTASVAATGSPSRG